MRQKDQPVHTTITMLGASGIGKTCFLVGMYAVMREQCPEGFTFSTDPDTDLKLDGKWNSLVTGSGKQRWPEETLVGDIVRYPFRFNYGLSRRVIDFDWLDYRGGALNDTASASDVEALKERLQRTDCVMLCVSGQDLVTAGQDRAARARSLIPRMLVYLTELAQEARPERPDLPVVVIVITKWDHCKSRDRAELIKQVKSLFGPLFVPDSGWLVSICPVTLGETLASDVDSGAIDPENIHVPVSFAAYCRLQEESDRLDSAAQTQRQRANAEAARRTTAQLKANELGDNWFKRTFWNSAEIAAQQEKAERLRVEVEDALREAAKSDAARATLLSRVQLVVGKLIPEFLPVFDSGKEVPRGK